MSAAIGPVLGAVFLGGGAVVVVLTSVWSSDEINKVSKQLATLNTPSAPPAPPSNPPPSPALPTARRLAEVAARMRDLNQEFHFDELQSHGDVASVAAE